MFSFPPQLNPSLYRAPSFGGLGDLKNPENDNLDENLPSFITFQPELKKISSNDSILYQEEEKIFEEVTTKTTLNDELTSEQILETLKDQIANFSDIKAFFGEKEFTEPVIVNSHASFRINCKVDLEILAKNLKNATYNPRRI